jgi:hypothetical protein
MLQNFITQQEQDSENNMPLELGSTAYTVTSTNVKLLNNITPVLDSVLYLDAGIANSYPGTGTTWYDLSGGGRHFTLTNGPTFITENGGAIVFDGTDDYAIGPASNAFGLAQEHTVEVWMKPTELRATTFFNWTDAAGNRQIMSHAPWSNNYVYYDVGGCCSSSQRVEYLTNIVGSITQLVFRCRTNTTPYRQVFENTVEKVNSGANSTAPMSFGSVGAIIGDFRPAGGVPWKGNTYIFRLYNRALTDSEIVQNFNANRRRFNL